MGLIEEFEQAADSIEVKFLDRKRIGENIKEFKKELKDFEKRSEDSRKAQLLIQEAAQQTQQELQFHISNLVTLALSIVFPNENIQFVARFVKRRNKTECDLLFDEQGNEYKPLDGSGYGPVNVAAFASRLALWALDPTAETMVLDEPFRDVSPDLQGRVGEMVKSLSEKLSMQIIMVSHAEDVNIQADRTFMIKKTKGVSYIVGDKKKKLKLRKGKN